MSPGFAGPKVGSSAWRRWECCACGVALWPEASPGLLLRPAMRRNLAPAGGPHLTTPRGPRHEALRGLGPAALRAAADQLLLFPFSGARIHGIRDKNYGGSQRPYQEAACGVWPCHDLGLRSRQVMARTSSKTDSTSLALVRLTAPARVRSRRWLSASFADA